jgi:hypothetical protein
MENKVAVKKCTKCGRVLPSTEFYKARSKNHNYLRSECKQCKNKYSTEYRKIHKEQTNKSSRKYYNKHREELKTKMREYYNKKKIKQSVSDDVIKNYEEKLVSNFKKQLDDLCVCECESQEQPDFFEITVYDWMPETQENVLYRCKKCGKLRYGVSSEVIEHNFICEECQENIKKQAEIKKNKFWSFVAKLFHK